MPDRPTTRIASVRISSRRAGFPGKGPVGMGMDLCNVEVIA
jgi:hypothetical protein